jgi:hypothetical protein
MLQSQQQRHRLLLAFAASNFQDNFSCPWAWGGAGSPALLRLFWHMSMCTSLLLCSDGHETAAWNGSKDEWKERKERPRRPSTLFPSRSVLATDRIMQRSPSRWLYINISMCRGSSQVKRFVAILPVSFASRIINNRVVKFPFPQNWAVRTTHRIHRTYCQMQHLFSRS